MAIGKINAINTVSFKGNAKTKKIKQEKPQNAQKDNKKKLALTLSALAATGAAIAVGAAILQGKSAKLADINFNKGQALLSSGEKFSGTIKDKLPNGDKIKMLYKDGILQQSTRKGNVNFIKKYNHTPNFAAIGAKLQENTLTDKAINDTVLFHSKLDITQTDLKGNIIKTSELKFTENNGKVKLFSFNDSNGKSYVHIGDNIEQFKNNGGKFQNGIALNSDGSKFSGNILVNNKNGNHIISYKDGLMQESVIADSKGNITGTKEYEYIDNSATLKHIKSNIAGDEYTIDFKNGNYTRVDKDKKTTFIRFKEILTGNSINPENHLYSTGMRKDMPYKNIYCGIEYPSCSILDVEDSKGNHVITRNFDNGMKDVLNLDKTGAKGTIEHYDENNNLVSKIERTFTQTVKEPWHDRAEYFGGTSHNIYGTTTKHCYNDIIYDSKGNQIGFRQSHILPEEN